MYMNKKYLKINYVPGPNIGDNVFPYMMYKLGVPFTWSCHTEHKNIISTGSIIGIGSKKDTIVWGSGIINANTQMHPEAIPVLVRGKYSSKSSDRARNVPIGDPAIALPHFYKSDKHPQKIKGLTGIIPHMIEYDRVVEYLKNSNISNSSYKIISPNAYYMKENFDKYIYDVMSCERVVSTSLHGIIIANAFGVPAAWWRFSDSLMGDDIKFIDYSSAFDHVLEKNEKIEEINNYWCPDESELKRVSDDIMNTNPLDTNILDEEYYTDVKSPRC